MPNGGWKPKSHEPEAPPAEAPGESEEAPAPEDARSPLELATVELVEVEPGDVQDISAPPAELADVPELASEAVASVVVTDELPAAEVAGEAEAVIAEESAEDELRVSAASEEQPAEVIDEAAQAVAAVEPDSPAGEADAKLVDPAATSSTQS